MMFEAFRLLAALSGLVKAKGEIHQRDRLGPF